MAVYVGKTNSCAAPELCWPQLKVNAELQGFISRAPDFSLVGADGSLLTIDHQSPAVGGWSPLRFARVSLGGLGIVTSVTIDVLPRPYATSLQGGSERLGMRTSRPLWIGSSGC